MPRKRPSLDAQLGKKAAPPAEPPPSPAPVSPPAMTKTSTRAKAREGKKAISGFFDPAVARQLKVLAAENDKTTQAMIGEALNLLFERYGKDAIARVD